MTETAFSAPTGRQNSGSVAVDVRWMGLNPSGISEGLRNAASLAEVARRAVAASPVLVSGFTTGRHVRDHPERVVAFQGCSVNATSRRLKRACALLLGSRLPTLRHDAVARWTSPWALRSAAACGSRSSSPTPSFLEATSSRHVLPVARLGPRPGTRRCVNEGLLHITGDRRHGARSCESGSAPTRSCMREAGPT